MGVRERRAKMTVNKQLELWLQGKPVHNKTRNECCPDFSCCNPKLLAPKKIRQVFVNASRTGDHGTVNKMLGAFLTKMLEAHNFHVKGG